MKFHRAFLCAAALVMTTPVAIQAAELVPDPAFSEANRDGRWWATPTVKLEGKPDALCAHVIGGTREPWDAIVGIDGVIVEKGESYRFSVDVTSETGGPMRAYMQKGADPWTPEAEIIRQLPAGDQSASVTFTATERRPHGQVVFHLGGSAEPWTLCLKNVSVQSGVAAPDASDEIATGSNAIRINQAGYLPDGPKFATIVSDSRKAVSWQLLDASGALVGSGKSEPLGRDKASGLKVHRIDFSSVAQPGQGYRLKAGEDISYPFAIDGGIYGPLARDAAGYFYPLRSGIAIDGAIAGAAYARPAGHVGKSPNSGDTDVPCLRGRASRTIYGRDWSCDYRLDVAGGWYDAGDFGKYVVNGGIAVAELMGAYEHALHRSKGRSAMLKDGALAIPESGNGVPDLLDEARWELDFLVSMQVPEGEPFAGMAHHKVHGTKWPNGPLWPHQDSTERVLLRPSTAATLNLAAAAAQGARLFAPYDVDYANHLLDVAVKAYHAAEDQPDLYSPLTDGTHGGGDYADDDVSDEFYWAGVELFLTTGQEQWYKKLKTSPFWDGRAFNAEGFDWRGVAGLARLQLASIPSRLPERDLKEVQNSVRAAAETYLATQNGEGFGLMYDPKSGYGWGSNHLLIQNMIVAAVAYDLTGKKTYLNGVRESMDYILGRNAIGISYVTGYGSHFAHHQYGFMFNHSKDPSFPEPPKGALAGGPNSQPADEVAISKLKGCAPQACYVDDPAAYSVNEIAINWNAALTWIAVFLSDTANGAATSN